MTDANVSVTFSAATGELEAGLTAARDALAALGASVADMNGKFAALGTALSESQARASQALAQGSNAAYADAMRAAQEAISGQIRAEQDGLQEKLRAYSDDVKNHRLSEQEKLNASREAVEQTYATELDLAARKRELADSSLTQRQRLDNEIAQLERSEQRQLAQLARESIDQQTQDYAKLGESVTGAFNTQLRGLLSGTTTWRDAVRNTLEQLLISFIESSEKSVVRWAAAEATKTSATLSGVAARTGAEQAGAATSLAAQSSTIVRSILSSAAEAFAGVFGFLAPIMGPFAAGPAAAAQATVASAVGAVASADIGMYSVPSDMLTLVHHNELIMPAAQADAFRSLLSGNSSGASSAGAPSVSISPTTHLHVNALDGASVSQWMRNNSRPMMQAIDEAVRHGAHLGLRRITA